MTSKNLITKQYPSSSGSAVYTAQYDLVTGESSCNCKGWTFKRGTGPRTCKHTKDLEANNGHVNTNKTLKPATKKSATKITLNSKNSFIDAFNQYMQNGEDSYTIEEITKDNEVVESAAPPSNDPTPMLASAMREDKTLDFYIANAEAYRLEEKLDGHRLLVTVKNKVASATARPRLNNEANSRDLPQHILNAFTQFPDGIYDGELYLPGGTSTDVVRLDKQDELVFGIFDLIELTGTRIINSTYAKRREQLEEVFWVFDIDSKLGVHMVENQPLTKQTVTDIWKRGGEGVIIKHNASSYKFGYRSPDWIKVKKLESAELTITGFHTGKTGPNSVAKLEDSTGLKTTIKVLNNEILADINKDPKKYINKKLVISYMGKAAGGGYKHAVWDHVL